MSDIHSVRAFLESAHREWNDKVVSFASRELAERSEPVDDAAGREEARELLKLMGAAGIFAPIGHRDLRACCIARELVAAASPLADAVWALQGLAITPLLIAGTDAQRRNRKPAPMSPLCELVRFSMATTMSLPAINGGRRASATRAAKF